MMSQNGNRLKGKTPVRLLRRLLVLMIVLMLLLTSVSACGTTESAAPASPVSAANAEPSIAPSLSPSQQAAPPSSPSPSEVAAEPAPVVSKVTVTFFGDAETSKGFTWYTDASSAQSDLQVIELTATKLNFASAMTFTGTVYPSNNSRDDELVHKAAATGLESGTTYYYRVGDAALDIWSEPAVFTTAPDGGAFSFINITDTQAPGQTNLELVTATIDNAMSLCENAGFIIHNGDVADSNFESEWNKYFKRLPESMVNMTIMPAAGNHDATKSSFIDHFNLDTPADDTTKGAYYSVTYSNTHFVVLNTNDSSDDYLSFSTEQVEWMRTDIGDARSAGSEWVIVVLHMGPYSTGSHADDANAVNTRDMIAPMFNELGVDLVLQGHDHVYDRSKPIVNGAAVPAETATQDFGGTAVPYLKAPAGPVYITAATAGTKHYYQNTALTEDYASLFETMNAPKVGDNKYNTYQTFLCFTIDGNKLTATAYQFSPNVDDGTPYIIDQFGILK
jgi:predicted phosphodiesterase